MQPRRALWLTKEPAAASNGSLHLCLAALPPPPKPPEAQREAAPLPSIRNHGLRRSWREQELLRGARPPPARGRGRRAVRRRPPLPRPPRIRRRRRRGRLLRAGGDPLRPRLLRPRRRHRRRRRQRPAHQGALQGDAGGRDGVRQQLRAGPAADDHGGGGGGDQGLGPLHRRRRRDPAHAGRREALAEAAAGAGLRGEGRGLQGLGAHLLRHPAQLHAPLRRRVRRQSFLLN